MWLDLLKCSLAENFGEELKKAVYALGLDVKEFARESGIPESSLYKIISGKENFQISTLRRIIDTVKRLEGYSEDPVVAVITTRSALNSLTRDMVFSGRKIRTKEYPATTIEEEIIQGVRAEKEGVSGIVCGPIAASTIEKVVSIPVISLSFDEKTMTEAIKNLTEKI